MVPVLLYPYLAAMCTFACLETTVLPVAVAARWSSTTSICTGVTAAAPRLFFCVLMLRTKGSSFNLRPPSYEGPSLSERIARGAGQLLVKRRNLHLQRRKLYRFGRNRQVAMSCAGVPHAARVPAAWTVVFRLHQGMWVALNLNHTLILDLHWFSTVCQSLRSWSKTDGE